MILMTKSPSKSTFIPLLVISLFGVIAYSTTFGVPFLFDDDAYIVNNPVVKNLSSFLSPREIATDNSLSPTLRYAFNTRYLGYLTLAVNHRLNSMNVFGYHAVNLLLHIINAWMLYLIATHAFRKLSSNLTKPSEFKAIGIPLFAALIFLCHPIQTQAVTYITSRFVLLASLFSLLTLFVYIQARNAPSRGLRATYTTMAVLCASAGMLTKEFTFTFPFIVAMYELFFFNGSPRERVRALWPYGLTLPIIPLLVFIQQGGLSSINNTMRTITAADVSQISRLDYLLSQFPVITLYLRLLILPVGQNVDHDIPIQHLPMSSAVLFSMVLLLILLSCAGYALWKSRLPEAYPEFRLFSFGVLWFFITLSVESSIIPLGELSAEYRLYLPSIGFIIATLSLGSAISRKYSMNRQTILSVTSALIIILSVATILRNRVWQSELSFWADAAIKSPKKARPCSNFGLALAKFGRLNEAVITFKRIAEICPNDPSVLLGLGNILNISGSPKDAIPVLERSVIYNQYSPLAYYELGRAYLLVGDDTKAISNFSKAINLNPTYSDAFIGLAFVYNRIERFNETIQLLEPVYNQIARSNRPEMSFNLCIAYSRQGKLESAIRELHIVKRLHSQMGRQLEEYLQQVDNAGKRK